MFRRFLAIAIVLTAAPLLVPDAYNAGFSLYAAAWPLLHQWSRLRQPTFGETAYTPR